MKTAIPSGYLPTLDGWRAIAILMVVFYHAIPSFQGAYGPGIGAIPWLRQGYVGVNIFFGISGVLITSRILEEQTICGRIDLKKFYLRRAFRILPPILVLLIVFSLLANFNLPISWGDRVRALFFASNYGPIPGWYSDHTWSLSVEEHFYIFWPLVLASFGRNYAIIVGLALSGLITIWRIVDIHYSIVPAYIGISPWRSDTNMDYLLLGAVVGCLMNKRVSRDKLISILKPETTLILLASFLATLSLDDWLPHLQHLIRCYHAVVIPIILAGTILYPMQLLGRMLEWSLLRWFGRLSYSLYLWQQLFFVPDKWRSPLLGFLQDWPFNFIAALGCAVVSYHLVERPLVKLGHKVARTLGGERPVPTM